MVLKMEFQRKLVGDNKKSHQIFDGLQIIF